MSSENDLIKQLDNALGEKALTPEEQKVAFVDMLTKMTSKPETDLIEKFTDAIKDLKKDDERRHLELVAQIKQLKQETPEVSKVLITNPQKQQEYPKSVKIENFEDFPQTPHQKEIGVSEPRWLEKVVSPLDDLVNDSKRKKLVKIEGNEDPRSPIAVRLSDGSKFYRALSSMIAGGGSTFPFVTSAGRKLEALVDDSGHLQVDVLTGGGGGTQYTAGTDTFSEGTTIGTVAGVVRNDTLASLVDTDNEISALQVNSIGALYTTPGNFVSVNNSTATVLDADILFTGTGDDCLNYSSISVSIDASHDSATDGVSLQFSQDNVNWDTVRTHTFDVSVTPQMSLIVPVEARYFRIVYTNGGTLQTHFRLQTILHASPTLQISRRLSDSESPELTGQLGKAVMVAQSAGTGLFVPVQATTAGNQKVSIEEINGGVATLTQADGLSNDLDGLQTTTLNYVYNGTTWDRARGDLTNGMLVNLGSNNDVTVTKIGSVVDAGNSSTTPLGIDGVFTGTGVDLLGYTNVTVQMASDVDSAANGISLEFSTDNSNWDEKHLHFFDFSDESARKFQLPAHARYFRVVYTNGGTGQGYFRLQTILQTGTPLTTIHRLDSNLAPDRSAQVMKSVLMAQRAGTGQFIPIDSTAGGNLKISVQEISDGLDIGAGNAGSETQRVSISTDDVNLSAIKTAVELLDNAVDGNYLNVNMNLAGADAQAGEGVITATTQRVTLATDDDGVTHLATIAGDTTSLDTKITACNTGDVTIGTALPAGTNAIGKLAANSGVDIGDVDVTSITGVTMSNDAIQTTGDEAHDAVDAGNPVKIGGRAQEPTTAADEVADNDRVDALFDRQGRLAVWMGYPVQSADINDASSGDNTIQAAAGAGLCIAVIGYHLISDGTVDYRWEDGAGGTAFTGQLPLQAREGISVGYGFQPMWKGSANTLLNLELSAAVNVHGQVSFVVMTD
jgi:hypothetical protein